MKKIVLALAVTGLISSSAFAGWFKSPGCECKKSEETVRPTTQPSEWSDKS